MAEKKAYLEFANAQIDVWKSRIAVLETRARQESNMAQKVYQEKIKELKNTLQHAENKLAKVKKIDGNSWETVRGELADSWKELGRIFSETSPPQM